jgi:hypothetical protein
VRSVGRSVGRWGGRAGEHKVYYEAELGTFTPDCKVRGTQQKASCDLQFTYFHTRPTQIWIRPILSVKTSIKEHNLSAKQHQKLNMQMVAPGPHFAFFLCVSYVSTQTGSW